MKEYPMPPNCGLKMHQPVMKYYTDGRYPTVDGEYPQDTDLNMESYPEVKSKPIGVWKSSRSTINTPEDAAVIARDNIGSDAQETLASIVTDKSGKILAINQHSIGGPDRSQVYPAILSGQILNTPGARNAWIVHNHPSGDAKVSSEDTAFSDNLSRLLEQSGIEANPIIAVTPQIYSAPGMTDKPMPIKEKATHTFDVQGRKFEQHQEGLVSITNPYELYDFGEKNLPGGGIILVNTQNSPVATIEVSDYSKLRPGYLDVLKEAERRNASGFMVYDKNKNLSSRDIDNLLAFENSSRLGFVAVYDKTGDRTDEMLNRKTALGGKTDFYSIKEQEGGKANEGRRTVGENKDRGRGNVLPEVREKHAREVDTQRQISSENPSAPRPFRKACEKGQGLTHYPEGYDSPE